jgi:hypothetical protein
MNVDDQAGERGKGCGCGPGKSPAGPPWFANSGVKRLRGLCLFNFGQGECNNGAALTAHGEMVEHLLAFVRGQSMFDEGADLVRVWMVPGLERLTHIGSIADADTVLLENVEV